MTEQTNHGDVARTGQLLAKLNDQVRQAAECVAVELHLVVSVQHRQALAVLQHADGSELIGHRVQCIAALGNDLAQPLDLCHPQMGLFYQLPGTNCRAIETHQAVPCRFENRLAPVVFASTLIHRQGVTLKADDARVMHAKPLRVVVLRAHQVCAWQTKITARLGDQVATVWHRLPAVEHHQAAKCSTRNHFRGKRPFRVVPLNVNDGNCPAVQPPPFDGVAQQLPDGPALHALVQCRDLIWRQRAA